MSEPMIWNRPLAWWEDMLHTYDDPAFRGLRIEPNDAGWLMTWTEYLPTDPWLGIHRDGTRRTMDDLGWVATDG